MASRNFRKMIYPQYKANRHYDTPKTAHILICPESGGWRAILYVEEGNINEEDFSAFSPHHDEGVAKILAEGLRAAAKSRGHKLSSVTIQSSAQQINDAVRQSQYSVILAARHPWHGLLPMQYVQFVNGSIFRFTAVTCEGCNGNGWYKEMGDTIDCDDCQSHGMVFDINPRPDDEWGAIRCHCGATMLLPDVDLIQQCPVCCCGVSVDEYHGTHFDFACRKARPTYPPITY